MSEKEIIKTITTTRGLKSIKVQEAILGLLASFAAISFLVGLAGGASNNSIVSVIKKCRYESIASYYNPAYRLGCEIAKPRWREVMND